MPNHILKCDAPQFDAVHRGVKLFEFRRNDREFCVGDTLTLEEIETRNGIPETRTGCRIFAKVVYILRGPDYGVPAGFCVMQLDNIRRQDGHEVCRTRIDFPHLAVTPPVNRHA